jgi:hypothetical protein
LNEWQIGQRQNQGFSCRIVGGETEHHIGVHAMDVLDA